MLEKRKYIQCVNNSNKEVSPKETIQAIKDAGFDGVFLQWFNKDWEFSQQEQLDLCRDLDLEIPFVHLSYKNINSLWEDDLLGDEVIDDFLRDLDVCKSNNIDLVVMHLTSKTDAKAPNERGLQRLQRLIDYAEKIGIKIAFENTKIMGYLEYVFDNIKNKNIGICFDIGHCHAHFDDVFDWDKFKGKIIAVHLHDNDKSKDQHLLPFDGTIDWDYYSKKLKEAEYTGPITLESCYRNEYLKYSLNDFYKRSIEIAKQLKI